MKKILIVLIVIFLSGCVDDKSQNYRYWITQSFGESTRRYYTNSYKLLPNGCVEFVGYHDGTERPYILCGTYKIE